ncbi:MAG: T9SS type A sorting domain-containing protein, partial [Bacteroidota bacterium]
CHTEILSLVIDNSVTYYADADGDGYGNPNDSQATCTGAPSGYVTDNGDCDDNYNAINPAATEVCNDNIDNNCDGQIDEGCGCLNPATVSAGANQTICAGDNASLSGSFGGGASTATWSTSGDGTFSPNASTMSATYIPGAADIAAGSVTLTLTTNAPFQCPAESSTMDITINDVPNAGPVSGTTSICSPGGNVFTYSIAPVAGATSYNWTVPSGTDVVSGQGTTSLSVRWPNSVVQAGVSGNICVTASNDCGSGTTSCVAIGVQISAPVTPPSISGAARVCPGDIVTYSVSPVARAQFYNWTVPAGASIVGGNLTNIIQVQFVAGFTGGTVTVNASNACGSGPVRTRNVILNNPLTPASISGQLTGVCGASGVTFTAASVSNATGYNWTVPAGATIVSGQGSATISVNFAGNFTTGNITVAATNGCGTGSARSATVIGAPGIPGVINGPSAVCTNGIVNYDVATVVGASTYTWNVPTGFTILAGQGTKILQVRGGSSPGSGLTLSVRATNACGTGASRAKTGISVIQCAREGEGSALNVFAYPNPASDLLNVSFTSDKNQDVLVSMMDAAGRLVVVENRNADEGSNKIELSVGSLASGIYTLQFRTADHVENIRVIVE